MRIALVGADVEENLGIEMVAAALAAARHRVEVVAYNDHDQLDAVLAELRARRPGLIGLGMQFQHRARDFVMLARGLRAEGYRGHLTAGGQYATLAADELVRQEAALDSVVLHDGETTVVELTRALERREPVAEIAGRVVRGVDGAPRRTAPTRGIGSISRASRPTPTSRSANANTPSSGNIARGTSSRTRR